MTTSLPDMTKYRSVSIENPRSRNDIFGDKVYDMVKDKHNQLKQSKLVTSNR